MLVLSARLARSLSMGPTRSLTRYNFVTEGETTPIQLVDKASWPQWLESLAETDRAWVEATVPEWAAGKCALVPGPTGIAKVGACAETKTALKALLAGATLVKALPPGSYHIEDTNDQAEFLALGWSLSSYKFDAYKKPKEIKKKVLKIEKDIVDAVELASRGTYLVRDLITTPAEDLGPAMLQKATEDIAAKYSEAATTEAIVGDDLLTENYPQVHAVGRGAAIGREPRVVKLHWNTNSTTKKTLVLVGKGVTFDTGGLNLKPGNSMLQMKKDMGGAAHAVALADMVMAANLNVNLVLLVGCVENSVSGSSFRPGDILTARDGTTTEVQNTDAEGRLVLADLLVEASSFNPDLILDMATLTGAGRVALGTDVPAMFCNSDDIAADLQARSTEVADQVWRLPLWDGYNGELESSVADLRNIGSGPYGGAITAALYLQKFISSSNNNNDNSDKTPPNWIHFDMMAYNQKSSPGKPVGGEAMGLRASFDFLRARYPPCQSSLRRGC